MADLMGYLGLDTKEFESGIKRAERATGMFAKAGKILGSIFAGAAFTQYIRNLPKLGKELDDNRAKFIKGSQAAHDYESATRGATQGSLRWFRDVGLSVDNLWTRMRVFFAQSILGFKMFGEDASDKISDAFGIGGGGNADNRSIGRKVAAATAEADYNAKIEDHEDKIAKLRRNSAGTLDQETALLAEQMEMERTRFMQALQFDDRHAANSARVAMGELENKRRAIEFQKLENERADEHAQILYDNLTGNRALADETEIRMEFEKKINDALKSGNIEAVKRLGLEQQTALNAEKIARHNQTPRERSSVRAAERKSARDLAKEQGKDGERKGIDIPGRRTLADIKIEGGRDADLQARADRGVKGREVEEFKERQKRAQAGIDRQNKGAAAVGIPGEVEFYAQGLQALKAIQTELTGGLKLK